MYMGVNKQIAWKGESRREKENRREQERHTDEDLYKQIDRLVGSNEWMMLSLCTHTLQRESLKR